MLVPTTPLLIGNWKTFPETYEKVVALATTIKPIRGITLCVCPPPLFLREVKTLLDSKILLGAQNYTSPTTEAVNAEVSFDQLLNVPIQMCIIGHSSSRNHGETDIHVNKKLHHCIAKNIIPIVCIGEEIRDNDGKFFTQLQNQIENTFAGVTKQNFEHIVIAYEPLWAIGSGAKGQASGAQFEEVVFFIKKVIADMTGHIGIGTLSIVYGGSVDTPEEVAEYMRVGARGILTGRASLNGELFMNLGRALHRAE